MHGIRCEADQSEFRLELEKPCCQTPTPKRGHPHRHGSYRRICLYSGGHHLAEANNSKKTPQEKAQDHFPSPPLFRFCLSRTPLGKLFFDVMANVQYASRSLRHTVIKVQTFIKPASNI